jgi:nucleoside phosphorylase
VSLIGLVVPLAEEFEYIRPALHIRRDYVANGQQYHRFRVPGSSVDGVAIVLYAQGETAAAVATARLLRDTAATAVALVGCAGGLDGDLRLGDVVVGTEVHSYATTAKAVPGEHPDGFAMNTAFSGWRVRGELFDFLHGFPLIDAGREAYAHWAQAAQQRAPDGAGPIRSHTGIVASGPFVSAAPSLSEQLRKADRKLLSIDTESGGVVASAERYGVDVVIIRGISDFADDRKASLDQTTTGDGRTGAWREYAVRNAAELFAALVGSAGFPWRTQPRRRTVETLAAGALGGLLAGGGSPTPDAGGGGDDGSAAHATHADHPEAPERHVHPPHHRKHRGGWHDGQVDDQDDSDDLEEDLDDLDDADDDFADPTD